MSNTFITGQHNKSTTLSFAGEALYVCAIVGALFLKSIYFQITMKLNRKPYFTSMNMIMSLSTLGVLLIITGLSLLVFNRKRKIALLAFDILLSLLLFADTVYFRYYSNPLTIPVLYQFGLMGSVKDSIASLIKQKDIIYTLDLPFLIFSLILFSKYFKDANLKLHNTRKVLTSLSLCLIGLIIFSVCYFKVDKSSFPYDNNYVVRKMGIPFFHYYDTKRFVMDHFFINKTLSTSDKTLINSYYNSKPKREGAFHGDAEGKNLLIVQVEALQNFVIGKSINGVEITPNLNKLIKESFYFNNFYYQVADGNTSDAEFLTNVSMYPSKEGAVYFRYPTNTFFSLPRTLKQYGYNTLVFHANNPSFWNRTIMYRSLGFDTFISYNDFIIDEFVGWGGWALSDASFYRQAIDRLYKKEPFYAFLISLSSHHPYTYFDEKYKAFDSGEYKGSYLGRYLKAVNYADKAIGLLVDDLKKRGLYEKTMLVVYGDHYAIPRDQSKELMEFLNISYDDLQWAKLQKVPCIIHYPGLNEGKIINTTGGEIDLFPTISNLMNLDTPYALGKDLLNTDHGYAVLRNGSVATDKFFYLSGLEKAFDINNGALLDSKYYGQELKKLQQELNVSDLLLQKDALKSHMKK